MSFITNQNYKIYYLGDGQGYEKNYDYTIEEKTCKIYFDRTTWDADG